MNELHELLVRATDRVESPHLEHRAVRIARRRRGRSRGAAAAVVASAMVVTVIVGVHGLDRGGSPRPAGPATPPATSPTHDGAGTVWPEWDPREVDELPAASTQVAPDVPRSIAPPSSSPAWSSSPIGSAVVAVVQGNRAQVLSAAGEWRTLPVDGRYPVLSLSPSGTRLAVHYRYDGTTPNHDYGVTVHDLATGIAADHPVPKGFEPYDTSGWSFLDDDTLALLSGPQAFTVDVATGASTRTSFARAPLSAALGSDGTWVTSADFTEPNVLTDYGSGTPREVSMDRTGRLSGLQVDEGMVVGTSYEGAPFGVVVADRETLTPQYRLPVTDFEANYSNWGLGTLALADDGTVLLRVAKIGRRGGEGFRVVAWEPGTGELSVVSASALPVQAQVAYATDALTASGAD